MQKVHFRLTSVAQQRCCLSSLMEAHPRKQQFISFVQKHIGYGLLFCTITKSNGSRHFSRAFEGKLRRASLNAMNMHYARYEHAMNAGYN